MRACQVLLVSATFLAIRSGSVWADDPAALPSHLVCLVRTELQKELVPGQADLFVLVDATNALKVDSVVPSALKLQELRAELARNLSPNAKLHFTSFARRTDANQTKERHVVRYVLMGLGSELGFSKVTAHDLYVNSDMSWADLAAGFTGKTFEPNADEPAVKSELVRAFRVRTPLSRFLTSDADLRPCHPSVAQERRRPHTEKHCGRRLGGTHQGQA